MAAKKKTKRAAVKSKKKSKKKTSSSASSSTKRRPGAPSKYDDLDFEQIGKLVYRGWTEDEIADFLGVTRDTIQVWKRKHPEFAYALKDWKIEADARVERSLFERATGYTHYEEKVFQYMGEPLVVPTQKHYPPNVTAAIFWLKNRKPREWRDVHKLEHSGSAGQVTNYTIDPSKLSDDTIQELMNAREKSEDDDGDE